MSRSAIGVGWLEEEFDALGQSFHDRGKRADAMIPLLRRLWSDDVIEEHNEHFDIGPVKFQPKPRRGSIPIEVGGTTAPALRRAGRLGDGWIEVGSPTLEASARSSRSCSPRCRDAGRDGEPFEVTLGGAFGGDLDGVRRSEEIGATRIIVAPVLTDRMSADVIVDFTKRFADEVITRV